VTPRIGVYGGTFDPIHIAHLAVAEATRESAGLSTILFVPNNRQPLKVEGPYASGPQRLRMLQAAIATNPAFRTSDVELRQEGPSYTIDTMDALARQFPDAELRFLLGADAALGLAAWREPTRLIAAYRPIIMSRPGWSGPDWHALERIHPQARSLLAIVTVPALAIASSELRARIGAGRSVRYLIPDPVIAIIEAEELYRDGQALDATWRGQ
jgi:nicotinate-nucleotide adenylyltransferase